MAQATGWNIQTTYEDRKRDDGGLDQVTWDLKNIWDQTAHLAPAQAKQFLILHGLAPALAAALITLKTNHIDIGINNQHIASFQDPIDDGERYSITNQQEDTIINAANRVFNATFKRTETRYEGALIGVRIYRVNN